MTNKELSGHFNLMSKLMEIHGENAFRAKSYSIAAYHIEQLPQQASSMTEEELFNAKGIGESTGKKILELLHTGSMEALDELIQKTPEGILEMLEIKGLGPKKIALLWREMGIENLGELEYACHENRLVTVKGFGAKTQQSILDAIQFRNQQQGLHLWASLFPLTQEFIKKLTQHFPDSNTSLTGAMRRQTDIVDSISFLTTIPENDVKIVLEQQGFKVNSVGDQVLQLSQASLPPISLHIVSQEKFHSTLFVETGPESFVEGFRQQYHIPATAATEEAIFSDNNLCYLAPALRENPLALQWLEEKKEINLIQPQDIKGIIHCHSTWSDGADTLEAMATAAKKLGYTYMVISDHSQSAYYARGLKPDQILAQHQEIDILNQKLAPFKIFKSIEADILSDGSLDYEPEVLASFDLVIASVHSNLNMTEEKAMQRLLKAIQNPFTTILGHPTGRLLLSRKGYPVIHSELIDACAAHQVVVEINAHPRRLDLDWQWISYAMEKQVLLSIDPDAHAIQGINDVFYGVMSAQKGGLTRAYNLSSFSLDDFEKFLARQKAKRG